MEKEEHNQNFWQLACIQGSALGTAVLIAPVTLLGEFGAMSTLIAIWIGNFILWVIGLAVVSIAAKRRKDAVENIGTFFGSPTGKIASGLLTIAFLGWYVN